MIHIFKTRNGEFCVVSKGDNGQVLTVSETFTQKQNAWKNIHSTAACFAANKFIVQDDTLKTKSKVYVCRIGPDAKMNFYESCMMEPGPRHVSKK